MTQIDCFISTVSPYVYLAGTRLEDIASRNGATVRYIPVDPAALFARTGGLMLKDRHESRKAYRLQELRRWSVKTGLKLNPQPMFWPVNPAPSAYAVIAAIKAGGGDLAGLIHGFGVALWAKERDIADPDVIADILATHGYDPKIADRYMLAAAETYMANLEEAVAQGAFGLPFYIVGEEKFWGQDRLDDLDLHLQGRL